MTEQDEAKAVGDLVLAKKRAGERLSLLEAEARKTGTYLSTLGEQLQGNPALVVFDQQYIDLRFSGSVTIRRSEFPTLDAILRLTDDTRKVIIEVANAEAGLKKYGL